MTPVLIRQTQTMGFPTGQRYKGTDEQNAALERQFLRKAEFMHKHGTPIWNGEFGPVYADPRHDADADEINQERYNLLSQQLRIYDKYQIHWSIWLYKDIGLQGMVHSSPDSLWNRTIQSFLQKKQKLRLDHWGNRPNPEVDAVLKPLVNWIDSVAPAAKQTYPTPWFTERHILRAVWQTFVAASFSDEFAELFKDFDEKGLDELAKSFAFENCVQREGLNRALREHAKIAS